MLVIFVRVQAAGKHIEAPLLTMQVSLPVSVIKSPVLTPSPWDRLSQEADAAADWVKTCPAQVLVLGGTLVVVVVVTAVAGGATSYVLGARTVISGNVVLQISWISRNCSIK